MKQKPNINDIIAHLTPKMLLDGVLANSHRYKPEPLLSTTGKGSLSPTTDADRLRDRKLQKSLEKKLLKAAGITLEELHREEMRNRKKAPANMVRPQPREILEERRRLAYADAIARGIPACRKLQTDEGGSISAEAAAAELGISKEAILKHYQKGLILAWREVRQKSLRFPVWQFRDHKVLDGLEKTLKVLNTDNRLDDFARMFFFLATRGSLGGKRPLDCLREGEIAMVLGAAQGYVE